MEWFGLTTLGIADPIKDMMRPDYKEPVVQLEVEEMIARGSKKPFSELIATIDCYIGRADGYAYTSYDRLMRMRRKGCFKPVGPMDMYKYAGTCAMCHGFEDPALKDETWYKRTAFFPKPATDVTHFVEEAKKIDKFFRM